MPPSGGHEPSGKSWESTRSRSRGLVIAPPLFDLHLFQDECRLLKRRCMTMSNPSPMAVWWRPPVSKGDAFGPSYAPPATGYDAGNILPHNYIATRGSVILPSRFQRPQGPTGMPRLIRHIDEIARSKGRDVLYVTFHETLRDRLDWQGLPVREAIIAHWRQCCDSLAVISS